MYFAGYNECLDVIKYLYSTGKCNEYLDVVKYLCSTGKCNLSIETLFGDTPLAIAHHERLVWLPCPFTY